MIRDNTRFGYYCSIALHTTVVVAAILWVVIRAIFPEEQKEPIDPFEMVEPAPEQPQQEMPATENLPEIQQQQDLKPLDKIEIPPEEPTPPEKAEPDPTPPEPKPEPEPAPSPKPKKVIEKPKPPKKVSFKDFVKRNPKVANRKPTTQTRTTVVPKIGKISASTSNISNIANISTKSGSSAAMRNILGAYVSEIRRRAKANWAIPTTAQNVDLATKIQFKVSKTGVISGLRVIVSSGNSEFDNSVLAAMRSISLPPPPDDEPHTVDITFTID